MAHDPRVLQGVLSGAAPPDLPLAFRPMFGGIIAYVEGKPFASLSDIGLALKCAGATHAALLGVPGAARLRYEPDAPQSKTYVVVPEAMLSDTQALRAWIARCAGELPAVSAKRGRQRHEGAAGVFC